MTTKNQTLKEILINAIKNHKNNKINSAEKLYKKILKINKNHFEANFLLGLLFIQCNKNNQAQKLFEKAVEINPKNPNAHYNFGKSLNAAGDSKNAIISYEKAIKLKPDYANAYNDLGVTYSKIGEVNEAKNCFVKAIEFNSNFAEAHYNLGLIFEKLKDYQKAKISYENTIQINPNLTNVNFNLGNVLEELGELSGAILYYQKEIKISPNNVSAYNNLALVYKEMDEINKSVKSYEEAIKNNYENLSSIYYLSYLKNEVINFELEKKIKKIITKKNCTKENYAYGNFLLSKYEFKEKNYKKEFKYLYKGHSYYFELKKNSLNKEINYWLDELPNEKILKNFMKYDKKFKKKEIEYKPIFIVGIPRCGSTLIEKVIASGAKHIPIGEETNIFRDFVKKNILEKSLSNLNIENAKEQIVKKYEQKKLIQLKKDYIFTDKSLDNFFYIGLINKIFPEAKIVNCIRNPLSSIMSIFKSIYKDIPWGHNLTHIFKYINQYNKILKKWKNFYPSLIYDLEYEKFVNDPVKESKKLFKFCNLKWNEKCLEFYKRNDIISKTASKFQIKQSIYKGSGDQYLQYKKILYKYGYKHY